MATESVATQRREPFYLPSESVNEAAELLHKAQGVLACISEGSGAAGEHAVANACWAVDGLLERVDAIVSMRQETAGEDER